MQKQKHEAAMKSAKKMIRLMKSKALASTFAAWMAFTKEAIGERVKMQRFLAKWRNQGVSKCYLAWTQYVAEEKRYRYLVNRFLQRLNNGVVFRIFASWVDLVEENKRNKVIIARFRTRMLNMEVAKSLGTWKDYVGLRLRAKYLARRIFNRAENGQILSAWIPWVEHTEALREKEEREREMEFMTAAQREEELKRQADEEKQRAREYELEAEAHEREAEYEKERLEFEKKMAEMKEAEAERKKELGLKMIQNMMNGCLAATLQGWKEYVKTEKHQRFVMKRFAKKLEMRSANAAYMQWIHYVRERKWLRGLLNRMLGGKEVMLRSAAFKKWSIVARQATEGELHSELEEMRDRNEELTKMIEDLQAKYTLLEGSMGEVLIKKQEQAMRSAQKMIQMMKGKALTSTFMAWYAFAREAKEDRVKMERFLAKWRNQGVSKCYLAWTQYVAEEKRYRYLVNRFLQRLNNGVVFRIFASWVDLVEENKRNKVIIARFRTRMLNMEVAKSLGTWKDYVGLRLRAKYLARRIFNRAENGQILSAWIPWVEHTEALREKEEREREMEFMTAAQREEELKRQMLLDEQNAEKEKLFREHEEARNQLNALKLHEAERKKELGLKMIQNMMNGCLVRTLHGWKEYVRTEKYNKAVIKRFAKKLSMRAVNSAYSTWVEYYKERKWLRGLLNRVLGGKDMMLQSAAFKAWQINTYENALNQKHNKELEDIRKQLIQAKSFHEETLKSAANSKEEMAQKLLKKTIFTLQSASMGKCFMAWSQFVSNQQYTRKLVGKVFSHVTNREITAGLNKWKDYVKEHQIKEREVIAKVDKRNKGMQMLADKANYMRIKQGSLKQAFVKWMLGTYTVTLSSRAVKRLDNFMLMFAHAFSSAKEVKALVGIACECLQSMIAGAAGTLMLLDKPAGEMWTVKSGAERRSPLQQGVMGFVGKTSESVYADLFSDERYNPAIDDIMLSKNDASPTNSKTWWGTNMPTINSATGSPVVLCIPVRDYDGITVAVLSAVRVHVERGESVKPFNPNDALALAVLSCYVGGHLEKLQGGKNTVDLSYEQVQQAVPDISTPPSKPLQAERSTMSSLVKKMEQKASTMEMQASNLQSSTKNLEKRLRSMSDYAKQLEGKMGNSLTIDTITGGGAGSTPSPAMANVVQRATSWNSGSPSSPGHKAWQQHTQALQKLFEVEKSLK